MLNVPEESGFVAVKIDGVGWIRPPHSYQSWQPKPFRKTKKPVLVNKKEVADWICQVRQWSDTQGHTVQIFTLARLQIII